MNRVFTLRTQHTPKPLAQAPSAVPPISEHSLVVKQVPLSPVLPAHSVFSNWTQVIRFRNLVETTSTMDILKVLAKGEIVFFVYVKRCCLVLFIGVVPWDFWVYF